MVAIVGFTLLGPDGDPRLLFGHGFELSNLDFALLSASCIGFIVTQVFGYGLISLSGYRRVAVGWVVGGVVFIARGGGGLPTLPPSRARIALRRARLVCGDGGAPPVPVESTRQPRHRTAKGRSRRCIRPDTRPMGARARIALVGAGAMGANHARVISESDSADLAVIIDTDRERVRPLAERLGCDFSEDLEAAARCDAAIIATPTAFHEGAARVLLELGKPILVEKPVTPDIETSRALVACAERRGVPLMCGFVERYNPVVATMRGAPRRGAGAHRRPAPFARRPRGAR